jgi:transcription elongation factor Elf1
MMPVPESLPTNAARPHTSERVDLAVCPTCHRQDPLVTIAALDTGASWHCGRCGQRWDAERLATVAAYLSWVANRTPLSATSRHT